MRRIAAALILALPTAAGAATAELPPIGWQEAVARLAAERTRAEACAGLLKRYGDDGARSRGGLAYAAGKAEVDAVVGGLAVALAEGQEPASLPDLEARLRRGVAAREAFCAQALPLVPAAKPGGKDLVADLLTGAIGPLVEALKALWLDSREADRLTRRTIQTQLEATAWPAFAAVPPAP